MPDDLTKESKVLIIRLSSIGDMILCTPVIRCLKQQLGCEIHFLMKDRFKEVLYSNPYIDKHHIYERTSSQNLNNENFDLVIDLHKNLRTQRLKRGLSVPSITFYKLNIEKWLLTNFKINKMPDTHLVDRYFDALKKIGIQNDEEGLDFFIEENSELADAIIEPYVTLVIGAAHYTKQIPIELCRNIIQNSDYKIVLLGGKDEVAKSNQVESGLENCKNMVGKLSLGQSAFMMQKSKFVITSDTGLMHIAAALKKPMITVWGSTAPVLGMYPYYGKYEIEERRVEINSLNCRPCTKIGKAKCPKGHFHCMAKISSNDIILAMKEMILRN